MPAKQPSHRKKHSFYISNFIPQRRDDGALVLQCRFVPVALSLDRIGSQKGLQLSRRLDRSSNLSPQNHVSCMIVQRRLDFKGAHAKPACSTVPAVAARTLRTAARGTGRRTGTGRLYQVAVAGGRLAQDYNVDVEVRRVGAVGTGSVLSTDVAGIARHTQDVVEGNRCKRRLSSMKLVRDLQRRGEAIALGHARNRSAYAVKRDDIQLRRDGEDELGEDTRQAKPPEQYGSGQMGGNVKEQDLTREKRVRLKELGVMPWASRTAMGSGKRSAARIAHLQGKILETERLLVAGKIY